MCWKMQSLALCARSLLTNLAMHATCCAKSEDIIIRHNSLRNLIDSIGTDAKLSPVLEKEGMLGNTTGRRPAFPEWAEGKGLAIDVTVTSPLAPSSLRLAEPCEWYAATKQHAKYDVSFESTNFIFSAMVFETLSAINVEGEEVLRQLFRFAAKRTGREFTSYCGRAWARFSCNLQRSVSQAVGSFAIHSIAIDSLIVATLSSSLLTCL